MYDSEATMNTRMCILKIKKNIILNIQKQEKNAKRHYSRFFLYISDKYNYE